MSTTSTLNSVLTALGGSNGIDVDAAVATIIYADRAPERAWAAQQATLTTQTAAINQLSSESSSLTDILSDLQSSTGSLASVSATSSNNNVLIASVAPGTASSNHLITVTHLATTGSFYSAAETDSSTALPDGSFSITANGVTTPIAIESGNNTLDELAASINSQNLGVNANVITDSTGARLSLVSQTSGSAGDISVSATNSLTFTRANTGRNAAIEVDGVPISSATNNVSGAINGVTLNLLGASAGSEITLVVAPDTSSIIQSISSFVSSYNTLIKDVNSQFNYNKTTGVAGTLSTDSTIQGLQSSLLGAANYNATGNTIATLSALGVSTNSDGTLSLNSITLANTLQNNSQSVASFFQGDARNGFVASLNAALNTYTDPTQGAFTVDLKSISSEYQDLTDQTNTLELYITAQQKTLTAQYNAADIAIQQLPQKLKQIQALLNPNSTSNS